MHLLFVTSKDCGVCTHRYFYVRYRVTMRAIMSGMDDKPVPWNGIRVVKSACERIRFQVDRLTASRGDDLPHASVETITFHVS